MIANKHVFKSDSYNCKCCGQDGRNTMTIHCPNKSIKPEMISLIQAGKLDFKDGDWISPNSEQKEKSSMKFVDSITEFMKAIEVELTLEASNELTDEDIDLLKNINSVPLPRKMVRDLELSIDQLVSLHKLKRLNYVGGNSVDNQYQIMNKGKEVLDSLKPKPVQLDIGKLQVLVLIYKKGAIHLPVATMKDDFNWLVENTRFIYPDVTDRSKWTLTPIGKEFIDNILSKQLLFI